MATNNNNNPRSQGAAYRPVEEVERDETEDFYADGDHEETPLLPTDLPSDIVPKKSFQRLVVIMGTVSLLVVTVSQSLIAPAIQEILEDVVCRKEYPDHQIGVFGNIDERCKDNRVQKTLIMVRSWDSAAELAVPIAVQLLYGVIADKYGRRIVLFLGLFGCVIQATWQLMVLWYPNTFSVWAVLYGNLAFLIGGGGQCAVAMIFTIFSDVIPAAQRTNVFFHILAVLRIVAVAAMPLAAYLMGIDPWLAVWIGYGILILGTAITLLIPETLVLRQKADDRRRTPDEPRGESEQAIKAMTPHALFKQALFSIRNDMTHIWRFLLSTRGVLLLIISCGVYYPVKQVFVLDLLQYMTKRYHWTWSQATYVLSFESICAVVVLMILLPGASWALGRAGYTPLRRDLTLARVSIIFILVGMTIIALGPVSVICIVGLLIYSLGSGFPALFRGLVCAIVEPHTLGTLNTAIAMTENIMGLASSPTLGWLLYQGFQLGGPWMGLSFLVASVLAAIVTIIMFVFRLPPGFERA